MMEIWAKSKKWPEGKYLVVRRDATIPKWPHFVLGARDPAAPAALRAYAGEARKHGFDPAYCDSILELADDFDAYRNREGSGDPDNKPHRTDDDGVVALMGGRVDERGVVLRWEP